MYLLNSHTGRNSQSHYVVHFRLNLELVSQLLASGLLTIWNRHYTDYSLTIKNNVNFNTTADTGGRYQLAAIRLIRNFIDYKNLRESPGYINDGSLYFDFKFDIPNVILDITCTDVDYASARLKLFKHCTKANKEYLQGKNYYAEDGTFLLKLEHTHGHTDGPTLTSHWTIWSYHGHEQPQLHYQSLAHFQLLRNHASYCVDFAYWAYSLDWK